MSQAKEHLKQIIEASLLASNEPLTVDNLIKLFESPAPSENEIKMILDDLRNECESRGVELVEVASGYRYQVKQDYARWVGNLWVEKPSRLSRALLETLALIAYRQPITRAEIESVRGVSVSSHIVKTLQEYEWVKIIGHRDVPGRPALLATTKRFLDDFNLKSLEELPTLAELRDLDEIGSEFELLPNMPGDNPDADIQSSAEPIEVAAISTIGISHEEQK
ncbi:MAG TPA: SMC-Scp complex subunit ScpB, partial [Gammaproteobacteria bacterium]|nr:SMC-Scp complex subunit ScpB [Gammaproteobacteria bacterium]